MNFEFSEDELALKDQARRFLKGSETLDLDRAMLDGQREADAEALWKQAAELGWAGLAIPEAYGGFGLGYVALCALAEEVGYAAAPLPLLPNVYLASEALLLAGSEAQKQRWLPRIAEGSAIGTVAISGTARIVAGRISGQLVPVSYASKADFAIVAASDDAGSNSLYLVELAAPGVATRAIGMIDRSHPHAAITLDGAAAEPLGEPGAAATLLETLGNRAAVLVAFEQVGGAQACLEMARDYALSRYSFGKLIGSYQAVKHKIADIYVKTELARSNAYYAAWALANDAPELGLAAATARVSATEAYDFAATENIQVHGGIGYTWEADCQLHYRRSRLLAQVLGTSPGWQERMIAALDQPQAA